MHQDHPQRLQNLVHKPVVADSELAQGCEITCKGVRLDLVQILCQPTDTVHNAAANCRIQARQITGGLIQDADLRHALSQSHLSNDVIKLLTVLPSCDFLSLA